MTDSQTGRNAYTIRLELVDEPGELSRALRPISRNNGNLLSVFHERGNVTPRGHIPVEVDVEATPDNYRDIVDALREAEINVVQAGTERYSESLTLLLVGDIIETDISDTYLGIQSSTNATITDFELSAPQGPNGVSSARVRLAIEEGAVERSLSEIRDVVDDKSIRLIEPLTPASA